MYGVYVVLSIVQSAPADVNVSSCVPGRNGVGELKIIISAERSSLVRPGECEATTITCCTGLLLCAVQVPPLDVVPGAPVTTILSPSIAVPAGTANVTVVWAFAVIRGTAAKANAVTVDMAIANVKRFFILN